LAAAAGIAVLGLMVGWVIGRADRNPAASDDDGQQVVTTQVATTISLVEESLPGEVDAIAISDPTFAGTVPTTMGASSSTALTRQSLMVEGIPFSFVSLPGWEPYVGVPPFDAIFHISKSTIRSQAAEALIFWAGFPEGTDANACGNLPIWNLGPNTADIAAALGALPGTELLSGPEGPEAVTVGGYVAHHVVFFVLDDSAGCDPGFIYNWKAQTGGALWVETKPGDTIRVWVVDVDGVVLLIAAETHVGSGSEVEEEIEQIISSIELG
jgi:hypothetical protein